MSQQDNENMENIAVETSGKNLFELIEFSLIRNLSEEESIKGIYGINVAKVREVVKLPKINRLASTIKGVEGVFELRGVPIPAINLCQILGDYKSPITSNHQIIVTEFSGKRAGFIVNSTHRIRRIPYEKVLPPSSDAKSCISSMILLENLENSDNSEFLFILDLEQIISDIESASHLDRNTLLDHSLKTAPEPSKPSPEKSKGNILLVEDSSIIRNNITRFLENFGFETTIASDGEIALDLLKNHQQKMNFKAIITDLEMPRMDGYALISALENEKELSSIPVIIHSSLNERVIQKSGSKIEKYPYVEKNDFDKLINELNNII